MLKDVTAAADVVDRLLKDDEPVQHAEIYAALEAEEESLDAEALQ